MLKKRTNDGKYSYFKVGEYKVTPIEARGKETVDSKNVKENKKLLETYNKIENKTIEDIVEFVPDNSES